MPELKDYQIKSKEGIFILIATILASGMAFLDGTVVNIAIPAIQSQFNSTLSNIQWVISGYSLMLCSLILLSGALGDKFGRKRIFLYGIILFTISSFLCSISQSISELILFRFIQGIGGAMMVPGSLSIIDVSFADEIRGRAIGLWSGFAGGVAALGPFLGGWLVQMFHWPSIFYINIPLGIIAAFITFKFVPESKNVHSQKIDLIGSALIFLSLLGITYGLISAPNDGWTNPLTLMTLIGGIILFILFIFSQLKLKEPLIPIQIFKSPLVSGANIVTLFLYFALSGLIFFLVLNLQQIQHYTPIQAGLAVLPSIILITFLSEEGGNLADKIGPRIPMIVGPIIVAIGMAYLIIPGVNVNYWTQIFPGLILFGTGMSLVIAPLTKSALEVDSDHSGAASGINNAVARIAGLLAVALLGAIVLSVFKIHLNSDLTNSSLNNIQRHQIILQENKLGNISMPDNFNSQTKTIAQNVVDDSFIFGFRIAMLINAILAFIAGIIAYFTIEYRNKKKNPL